MSITRPMWWLAGGVAVVVLAVVLVWFEPQALFIDERVSDPVPTVDTAVDLTSTTPPPAAEPMVTSTTVAGPIDLAAGDFVSHDHGTEGHVRVLQLADGSRHIRIEGLATDNGPDLFVYLSTNPADGPEGAFDEGHVNLGALQGNLGDQNYAVPADVDPSGYASVVIWCDRFDSAFGAADLAPA